MPYLRADVSREEIEAVVQEDAIAFDPQMIPGDIADELAAYDVVFLGEVHNLQNQADLIGALATALQPQGFRHILLECFHAFDWMINAYALGEDISLHPYVERYYGSVLEDVRALNMHLPPEERIQVHAIDINHDAGALGVSLQALAATLPDSQVLETLALELLERDPDAQTSVLEAFRDQLEERESEWADRWGAEWVDQIAVMIDVQLDSIVIKQRWNSDYHGAHRLREAVICSLVDDLLLRAEGGTLINMGFNHAQLTPLRGTNQEWLGEYLHESSEHAGDVYSLCVMITNGYRLSDEGELVRFNLLDDSRNNELLRVMWENFPEAAVFLPFQASFFHDRMIPVNLLGDVRAYHPAAVYDALILLHDARPLESLGLDLP